MPQLILLQGIPGSGKSTLAQQFAAQGCFVISYDAIRAELGDVQDQSQNALVVAIARERAEQALAAEWNVVIDGTHVKRAWTSAWEALAARLGVSLSIERVDCPLDRALAQNAQRARQVPEPVIMQMHDDLSAFDSTGISVRIHIVR